MLQEELVTYEVCKLAKEKGFPQDGHDYYYAWDGLRKIHPLCNDNVWYDNEYSHDNLYAAPTQSLLQRWLREEKGIYIETYIDWEDSIDYNMIRYSWRVNTTYKVGDKKIGGRIRNESELYFDTYELALEDALKYTFENLV
jgi:hypothetical protein